MGECIVCDLMRVLEDVLGSDLTKPQSRVKKVCASRRRQIIRSLLRRLWPSPIQPSLCLRDPCKRRLNLRRSTLELQFPVRMRKRKFEDGGFIQRCTVLRLTCAEQPFGQTKWPREDFGCHRATHGLGNRTEAGCVEEERARGWNSLPHHLQDLVLGLVDFRGLSRFKLLSKASKQYVESDDFRSRRGSISEGSFTAFSYYIKNKAWWCSAYDLLTKSWRAFPPFSTYLPTPDPELFKEYSVTGHGGLMCAEVSKLPKKGELVVFNPMTGEQRALPPLLHPRVVVLLHLTVNPLNNSFRVIVAGSSSPSDEHLSRKIEVFDSVTWKWTEACDLPGPTFGLNEHQGGVYLNGILYMIAFLESGGKGVVTFEVETGKWGRTLLIEDFCCCSTLQLVENGGKVYLFSEREQGQSVVHRIHELELLEWRWKPVVEVNKSGGRGLLVYPEQTCVGFGEGKLCIFNALNRDGVVYDMRNGQQYEVVEPPPPDQKGDNFFSLNPALFSLQPNFAIKL